MGWTWVNDIMEHGERKKAHNWDIRCPVWGNPNPLKGCPSNYPYRGANKPRMKFIQRMSLFLYQYKCKDCGVVTNFSIENSNEENDVKVINSALCGGKADYKFHV